MQSINTQKTDDKAQLMFFLYQNLNKRKTFYSYIKSRNEIYKNMNVLFNILPHRRQRNKSINIVLITVY